MTNILLLKNLNTRI